jgi:HSP20 family protein
MAIIRWNPWSLDRFFEDDWDVPTLPGLSQVAGQGLNLYETETQVIAEAAIPGIPEDKIEVSIDDDIVRITGSSENLEEDKNKRRYYMSSMGRSYNYSFRLPRNIDNNIEPTCELDNGVLTLKFSKVEKPTSKKIPITKKSK